MPPPKDPNKSEEDREDSFEKGDGEDLLMDRDPDPEEAEDEGEEDSFEDESEEEYDEEELWGEDFAQEEEDQEDYDPEPVDIRLSDKDPNNMLIGLSRYLSILGFLFFVVAILGLGYLLMAIVYSIMNPYSPSSWGLSLTNTCPLLFYSIIFLLFANWKMASGKCFRQYVRAESEDSAVFWQGIHYLKQIFQLATIVFLISILIWAYYIFMYYSRYNSYYYSY